MNIGFDAKRAFHNGTGLGHYSRTLICSLAKFFLEHQYHLFNPKPSQFFEYHEANIKQILPTRFAHKMLPSIWRSRWMIDDVKYNKTELFHGLSHELPFGISELKIPTVVTIHDLIFEKFPNQYSKIDAATYSCKYKYACNVADKIIAISEQTKKDLMEIYKIKESKIVVCYQACNEIFASWVSDQEKDRIRKKYNLPAEYYLSVGSIIERKNLLNVCKAMSIIRSKTSIPLVVIGDGKKYKQKVKDYIKESKLEESVIFLSETEMAKSSSEYKNATDFPAIYQMAKALIYPSFYEGFGIPVLEALWSKVPVITSNTSCLPEAGGINSLYINPAEPAQIAEAMQTVVNNHQLVAEMQTSGLAHAQKFSNALCAKAVMDEYDRLV